MRVILIQTKTYRSATFKGFKITIYKKLKASTRWYSYQAKIKLFNLANKEYMWYNYTVGSLDEDELDMKIPFDEIFSDFCTTINRYKAGKPVAFRFPSDD